MNLRGALERDGYRAIVHRQHSFRCPFFFVNAEGRLTASGVCSKYGNSFMSGCVTRWKDDERPKRTAIGRPIQKTCVCTMKREQKDAML